MLKMSPSVQNIFNSFLYCVLRDMCMISDHDAAIRILQYCSVLHSSDCCIYINPYECISEACEI